MGFGFLFIGYFFLLFYPLDTIGMLPNLSIIGCVLMLAAMKRLIQYCPENKSFKAAKYALVLLSLFSAAMLVLNFIPADTTSADSASAASMGTICIYSAVLLAKLTLCIYSITLFLGIHRLSNEVELPKLASAATRRITVTGVFGAAMLLSGIAEIVISSTATVNDEFRMIVAYVGLFSRLLEYVCILVNLLLIFSCYAKICLEGDEDMPYREDVFDKIIAWTKRNKK
ncbi:MAG: hypothetical protein IJY93_09970 [Clostridia bacterium]|nr:hypothetical protein [Clostridia bacterium]